MKRKVTSAVPIISGNGTTVGAYVYCDDGSIWRHDPNKSTVERTGCKVPTDDEG